MTSDSRPDTGDAGRRVLELLRSADSPVYLAARGFCMEPLVRDGDVVEVLPMATVPHADGVSLPGPVAPGSLPGVPEIGAVVLAGATADRLVCHRLLARVEDRYLLAGDRSLALESFDRSAIHGVVRSIEREGQLLELGARSSLFLERWLISLHLWCAEHRGTVAGRLVNRLRRGLLWVRATR